MPGRVALAIDPDAIEDMSAKLASGSVVVCGTNGKTTTTNVIARAAEAQGFRVLCNREGANMESGVAAALLPGRQAQWGVFENDELSTLRVVPKLRPKYLVLLNLFRDQLDRCGEIDRVQETIAEALARSPETVLVYNADDPLCKGVSVKAGEHGVRAMAFGVGDDMRLAPDRVRGGGFCQVCGAPLRYRFRQYGQLGDYSCPACGFSRGEPDVVGRHVDVGPEGVSLVASGGPCGDGPVRLNSPLGGAYMAYNVLAAYAAARLMGVSPSSFQEALYAYDPGNGRLQRFDIGGRRVTLNLAKNPTGFNQNMGLLMGDTSPKVVYIAINDDYNDGRDVSWLWDVDFERLSQAGETKVFVGGHRANDMQVRLKYAGVPSTVAPDVGEALEAAHGLPKEWDVWVLTNYSALWPVKAELERMEAGR